LQPKADSTRTVAKDVARVSTSVQIKEGPDKVEDPVVADIVKESPAAGTVGESPAPSSGNTEPEKATTKVKGSYSCSMKTPGSQDSSAKSPPIEKTSIKLPGDVAVTKRIPRGSLGPQCGRQKVVICHLESPACFFICLEGKQDVFLDLMAEVQSPGDEPVVPEVGGVCLSPLDDFYYRAEVTQVSPEQRSVEVFLLDDGRSLEMAVDTLRSLTVWLEEPGLVVRVGLAGL
jgi:hypothetical protein